MPHGNTGKKRNLSPETRQKLSELAKKRVAEGTFGGAKFGKLGGRPRKDRAAARVAEAAQEDQNARQIIQVFKDAVDSSQSMGIRLKAAEAWLGVEREEGKLALQEEQAEAQHSREELIAMLAEKLTAGPTATILRNQLEEETGIVDAVVVDDDEDNPFIKKARANGTSS